VRLRRGRAARRGLRLLFATDLHGSEIVFRKFLNAVTIYEADVAILGGDLTGKQIVPVVASNGHAVAELLGAKVVADTGDERSRLVERIRNLGQYPVIVDRDGYEALRTDAKAVEQEFHEACACQVADWMERAAARLSPLGVPLFVTGGNDDYLSIEEVLEQAEYVVDAEGRIIELRPDLEMISTGYGNETPWHCPRDVSEEELARRIDRMASQLASPETAVFNLHVPPFGTGLDTCPRLDTSVEPPRPIAGEETAGGSRAVLNAIERYRPLLSLHGHIHESPGIRRLGATTAINPGSEYAEGMLRSAVVDITWPGARVAAQLLVA
jgi:Icc-related predicted phosphoesterase